MLLSNFILGNDRVNFNAMAPLHIMHYHNSKIEEENDWILFETHLEEAKRMGVDAISVDVWWGLVEEQNNQFDWSYYIRVFDMIISKDLDIIPIMSFHSFDPGKNAGFRAPIPDWVWELISKESGFKIRDLKYNSEDVSKNGSHKFSDEYVSLWADKWAFIQYQEFLNEFVNRFDNYLKYFQEINISLGPTGELRYPSYNGHDGGRHPNRGRLQCFSIPAQEHYFSWLQNSKPENNLFEREFIKSSDLKYKLKSEDYLNDPDIESLFEWYNSALMEHGNGMLKIALNEIPETIPIGFKIPGIHWRIKDPKMPRISEMTCGLINSKSLNGQTAYSNSLKKVIKNLPLERLILHFTCIDQTNSLPSNDLDEGYSRPENLVMEVSSAASELGLKIKGENSLTNNLYKKSAWLKIKEILSYKKLSGVTIMRLQDITKQNSLGNEQYKELIKKFGHN